MNSTLISADQLKGLMAQPAPPIVLDISFDLADTAAGERSYGQAHLPGAHYVHLDRDLSAPKTGRNGRHPLPSREAFAETAGRLGITPQAQVVVLDAQGGMYAVRAWWMLKWLGHEAVAVLDGGLPAWQVAGGPVTREVPSVTPAPAYPLQASLVPSIDADTLQQRLQAPELCLIDARAPERYRGDVEPLDPVAGHIPGALNRFFKDNLDADGRFKSPARLRAEFEALLAGRDASDTVHQCGSGVTSCLNLLAMEVAGLKGSSLYPGSWSEWCADPGRPVARG